MAIVITKSHGLTPYFTNKSSKRECYVLSCCADHRAPQTLQWLRSGGNIRKHNIFDPYSEDQL